VSESDDVLERLFPGARFLNIVRRDRRAQALSYFRARATDEWEKVEGIDSVPRNVPPFNADAILALEADLTRQQEAWKRYFLKRGIVPLVIEYETLASDYRGEIARALRFLGLDASVARAIPPPRLVRQADEVTACWRRLMETAGDRE